MCKKGLVPQNPSPNEEIYTNVDQPPVPQGGKAGLAMYLARNLRYPPDAMRARLQGRVIVSFVVTRVGRITDIKIKEGIGGDCDREAIRIVKEMPNWTPGQLNGKPVNVLIHQPITFTL